ncbi:glycosyltransferase [Lactobacillus intestinalis]|uniref:glycosyltransferase n=1 Tax=Lactobacillus intestinalis TaxID=151781 RepID=UPI001F5AEBFA|nr:glycosyltransferase [Lactobacillus intestinalis]
MKDVSFVIPVYNTEIKLLSRCLQSLTEQKNINYEIIIINDGSMQVKSHEYEKIAYKYSAKYFYQNKQGVSVARNRGIKEATGKYISFVDSDDKLISNSFFKEDLDSDIDFLIYNVEKVDTNLGVKTYYHLKAENFPTSHQMLSGFLNNDMLNWSVGKLYKKEFLTSNHIFFDKKRISGEDFVFVHTVYTYYPKIKYVPRVVYEYLYSDATGRKRILSNPVANINDIMTLYKIRERILKKNNDLTMYKVLLCQKTINDLFSSYSLLVNQNLKVLHRIYQNYIEAVNIMDKSAIKELSAKFKIKIFLIKHKSHIMTKFYNNLYKVKQNYRG